MPSVANAVYQLFNIILLLMLVKVFLSWIPNINWYNEPFKSLNRFAELFFGPFRKLVPPIGMIDISPIFAFIIIGIIQRTLVMLLLKMGL